jgi:hypothetical protein
MGFRAAFGQQSGPVGDESDLFALARFPMGGNYVSMERLRSSLSMHPLDIEIIRPDTPFVASEEEAPQLVFKIENPEIQVSSMTCYIPGQDPVTPQVLDEKKGIYQVQAQNPLQGRRSKYTLTVQDRDNRWYWFSHLWINPAIEERYAE